MPVHLRERELLAELVAMPVVRLDVDRPLVEERFVQTVQLFAECLLLPFDFSNPLCRVAFHGAPRVQNAIFDEAHEARRRLQSREFVNEQFFESCLSDVHGPAAPAAMVVGVVVAAPLRPARRQRLAAGLATDVTAEREVRIVALPWPRNLETAVEDRLHAKEDLLADQRLKVASPRNPEVRHVDLRDIHAIAQHAVERLRRDGLSTSCLQAESDDVLADFVLRESSGRELLEGTAHKRHAFRIRNQALPGRARRVEVAEWRQECPASKLQRGFHPATCPFRTHVVIELCESGKHALHQLAR